MPVADLKNKIAKARTLLLLDHPFWGHLTTSLGEPIERNDLNPPTMATDGSRLYYSPEFVKDLPLDQLTGVLAHEVCHPMLDHINRQEAREQKRWNIATDIAVNEIVRAEFILPPGVCYAENYKAFGDFADKEAEFIYNKLTDENTPKKGGKGNTGNAGNSTTNNSGSGNDPGKVLDDHSIWEKSATNQQDWYERVAQAANAARMAGRFPDNVKFLVNGVLNPQLSWHEILRDTVASAVKSNHTYSPPNKKLLYRRIYLPSITGETISIALAIDTSGSISDEQLTEFMSELKGILDQYDDYEVHVFFCDAVIHEAIVLTPYESFPEIATGRGGTSFKPAMEAMKNIPNISAIVYLTDGEPNDGWPDEPEIPVIWILTASHGEPPYGMKIVLPK